LAEPNAGIMGCTLLGFLIAPLWVSAVVGACTPWMFPHTDRRVWVYITVTIASVFSHGGSFALGLPMLVILHRSGELGLGSRRLLASALASLRVLLFSRSSDFHLVRASR
jgi:hypothetical protein